MTLFDRPKPTVGFSANGRRRRRRRRNSKIDKMAKDKLVRSPVVNGGG